MNNKLKSFGLIEALVSSFIILAVIGAAVGLARSNLKTSSNSVLKLGAGSISSSVMEKIIFLNNEQMIDYEDSGREGTLSYKCLDSDFLSNIEDRKSCIDGGSVNKLLPYYTYITDQVKFNSKTVQDGEIKIENNSNNYSLKVNAQKLSANSLKLTTLVSWKDSSDKIQNFQNSIDLTR